MRYAFLIVLAMASVLLAACATTTDRPQAPSAPADAQQAPTAPSPTQQPEPTPTVQPEPTPAPAPQAPAQAPENKTATVTMAQLASHNTEKDCWVGYQGKAYDVTSFLPLHPGGIKNISRFCGTAKEFEEGFIGKHGMSKVSMFFMKTKLQGDLVS